MRKIIYESFFRRYLVLWILFTLIPIIIVISGTDNLFLKLVALPNNIILLFLVVQNAEHRRALRCLQREYPEISSKKYLKYFGILYKRDRIEMHNTIANNPETAKIIQNHKRVIFFQIWTLTYFILFSIFYWM